MLSLSGSSTLTFRLSLFSTAKLTDLIKSAIEEANELLQGKGQLLNDMTKYEIFMAEDDGLPNDDLPGKIPPHV